MISYQNNWLLQPLCVLLSCGSSKSNHFIIFVSALAQKPEVPTKCCLCVWNNKEMNNKNLPVCTELFSSATHIYSFYSFEYLMDYCFRSQRGFGIYNEHKNHTFTLDLPMHGAHYNKEKCSQYNVYIMANWSWRYLYCQWFELRPWHFQKEQSLNLILDLFAGVMLCFKELHNEWLGVKAEGPGYQLNPQPWLI